MNILPLTSYKQNCNYNPNFTSCAKIYDPKKITSLDIFAKDKVRTTTGPFRSDQNWNDIMKYIFWNFSGEKKVNIACLACSDSSESLSYALYLHSKTPKSYYKKFHITGSDIDPEMIKIAKSGKINLSLEDFTNMRKYIKDAQQYFKECGAPVKITNNVDSGAASYKIAPEVHSMMKFKKSDILTEVKHINPDEYYVLNIKNVFPYLKTSYNNEVLETMSKKLKSGSLFIYGKYDLLVPNFRIKLLNSGFFEPIPGECFVQKI